MKGWLIYNAEGAKRNEWFISRLIEECAYRGAQLRLKIAESAEDLSSDELPDFAICRAMNADINAALENKGVRAFNNAETARIAGDKWETYRLCQTLGIPVLQTSKAEEGISGKKYPLVVKSRFGHGGSEVYWSKDEESARALIAAKDKYILQEPCKELGKDIRVYVVGGKIVAAVLRESEKDFRSNFSLGGKVRSIEPTEEQKNTVGKLHEKLYLDFVGVDFLPDGEGYVLNEMEDAAGTRMLYACSDIDIVPVFVEHVINSVKKGAGLR